MKYKRRRTEISKGRGTKVQEEKNKKWGEETEIYEKRKK
jgi:hypothetical protein